LNRRIFDKLGMHNRVEVALWYIAHERTLKT
jgi:DNA-binding CsgD family transcriptional regulator